MTLRSVICLLVSGWACGFTASPLGRPGVKPMSLTRVEASRKDGWDFPMPSQTIKALAAGGLLAASLLVSNPLPVAADTSRIVGQLQGSGLVFKDTLQIESFEDPKIKGVTLYISNFQRPLTERLTSNFLADPSDASVSCARTGPVIVADNIGRGKGGEEVFEESRSLLFKTLRVRRVFDEEKKTVIYVSYNTRFDKNDDSNKSRFKSSLCAVSLEDYGKPDLPSSPPSP
mmetsp:Transcript_18238/g.34832  ORF Transcript_18238/g.34832 Transcript_18238/m.34832 type:complete len:230 (+) Transcript_18238:135-824(+)